MDDTTIKTLSAIGCLTVLEALAILNGINGTLFSTIIMVIAGLGGYSIGQARKQESKK